MHQFLEHSLAAGIRPVDSNGREEQCQFVIDGSDVQLRRRCVSASFCQIGIQDRQPVGCRRRPLDPNLTIFGWPPDVSLGCTCT